MSTDTKILHDVVRANMAPCQRPKIAGRSDCDELICQNLVEAATLITRRYRLSVCDAEEFVQDFVVSTLCASRRRVGDGNFSRSWAVVCATNHYKDFYRGTATRRTLETSMSEFPEGLAEILADREDSRAQVDTPIEINQFWGVVESVLTPKQKHLFILHYRFGVTIDSLAELCHCQRHLIDQSLFCARKRIRGRIDITLLRELLE